MFSGKTKNGDILLIPNVGNAWYRFKMRECTPIHKTKDNNLPEYCLVKDNGGQLRRIRFDEVIGK